MAERLTTKQREALSLIADRTDERSPDPGVMCSDATFADTYNAFVNWRTAQALHRAGLVTYPYIGCGFDGDNTSIALTESGWSTLSRVAPVPHPAATDVGDGGGGRG